jgi:hypothetical protein
LHSIGRNSKFFLGRKLAKVGGRISAFSDFANLQKTT